MNTLEKVKINNPQLISLFQKAFEQNKIAHSFIFSGPEGMKIINEPMLLINSIIENKVSTNDFSKYSDLNIIDGSESLIKKDNVISMINKMSTSALDSRGYKFLFIKNIENGNKQSLNSLLKFIEEPQDKTFIVMTSNNIHNVLNTIKSRSQIINLKKQSKKLIKFDLEKVDEPLKSIIVQISSSSKEALSFSKNKKIKDLILDISNTFEKNINDKYGFIISLNKLFNKNNFREVILILRVFINDIWKSKNNLETICGIDKILLHYKNINYKKILEAMSYFINTLKQYGNFELAKTRLLLEMEKNYE